MNNDCLEVDALPFEIADYTTDYSDMAVEAYQYLRDRVHNAWLPDSARQQLRRIIKKIGVQIQQSRGYRWAHEFS